MVDRYEKWHVKNQSEIKMLYWQVKNHNDHKANKSIHKIGNMYKETHTVG